VGSIALAVALHWQFSLAGALIALSALTAPYIAIGETAPLLYTAGFSNSMPSLSFTHSPVSYLTYAVWEFYNYPSNTFVHLSYDAALILVVLVLLLIITARLIVSFTQRYTEKN
jgi:phosphate transport system permease protein